MVEHDGEFITRIRAVGSHATRHYALPVRRMARASIGTILTAMQLDPAVRRHTAASGGADALPHSPRQGCE
jgi:hypothetical protein